MLDGDDVTKPLWPQVRYRFVKLSGEGALYGLSLKGRMATAPKVNIANLWPGNTALGEQILKHDFVFSGELINQKRNPWIAAGASDEWLRQINSFNWLNDLSALGGDAAFKCAQSLALDWVNCNQDLGAVVLNPMGWRGDIIGRRLFSWITHWQKFFEPGELNFRHGMLKSIGRQLRHLRRVAAHAPLSDGNISALKGWIVACLTLESEAKHLETATDALGWVIDEQVLADGGHISRNPAKQLSILRDLVDIRLAFRDAKIETPTELQIAIDKMAPLLRFYRHGDKGLALFNGSNAENAADIDQVLSYADARGRAPNQAPHSGYEKLKAGKLCIFMDVGNPPPPAARSEIYAGALSIEVSVGKDRMIVNCGTAPNMGKSWQGQEHATAAHSTLCLADTNSTSLSKNSARHAMVTSEHLEEDGSHWITASHDGYKSTLGATHTRRLFLTKDGEDLRGEDSLDGPAGLSYNIRFHLHPKLRVSILHNQASALLKLPNGEGWRLRVAGADMKLMDSIYFGDGGDLKRAQQIVLSAHTQENSTSVKWALRRERK